jgi:exopolysaccharide biosynthesis polyprenyl glycosylphosphotransferase
MMKQQNVFLRFMAQVMDVGLTVTAFLASFPIREHLRAIQPFGKVIYSNEYYVSLVLVVLLWWLIFDVQNAYRGQRYTTLLNELKIILRTVFLGTVSLVIIGYILKIHLPPRSHYAIFLVVNIILLTLGKSFIHYLSEYLRLKGINRRSVLIVGAGSQAHQYIQTIRQSADWDMDLIGFIDKDPKKQGKKFSGAEVLGTPKDLPKIMHHFAIDEIVFALPTHALEEAQDMLTFCEQEGVKTTIVSNFFSGLIAKVQAEVIHGLPVLTYSTAPLKEWELLVKRFFDIIVSSFLLILTFPLQVSIAILIKLTSKGPIFYRWQVVGLNKKRFTGYKFRTMVRNADQLKKQLLDQNEMNGVVFKIKKDPRVTWLGRILRKFSLDELPQLWSVLRGDMSLVGPRPPLVSELELFESWHRRKLSVKPGLTCLWQIRGRSNIKDFNDWVKLDLEYIDNWSFWLDIKILLQTIPVVLFGRGAH